MGLQTGNALVTGGGSGLGLACARRFLVEGATVTIAGRTEQRLRHAAAALEKEAPRGAEVRWIVCDVADEAAIAAMVATADAGAGLRFVVASAGTGWVAPLATIPAAEWRRVADTTLAGVFLTLKHAAPRLAEAGGGAFTAISSVSACVAPRFAAPYNAAKAGVDALIRTAADEFGPAGIRVNAIRPGLVPTPLSGDLVEDDEIRNTWVRRTPLGRLGTVDDIAAAALFLSSTDASWITGVCLDVDGGLHLHGGSFFDPWVRREHAGGPAWWGIDRPS